MLACTIDVTATGAKIRAARKAAGLKSRDVQEALGLATCAAIYKWERGASLPSLDNLVVLARLMNCKLDDLIVVGE